MYITEDRLLKYALYSNTIYVFLLFLLDPNGINIQKITITLFLVFSVVSILLLAYRNRKKIADIPKSAQRLFTVLMLWSLMVMFRGITFNIQDLVTNFGNVYMALAWFVPITLLFGIKIENWKIVFKALWFMFSMMLVAMFFFPYHAALPGKLKTEWTWLLRAINFLIIFGINKFSFTKKALIFLTFCVYIIIAIETEQRIEFVFLFVSFFFLFIIRLKNIRIKRYLLKYIIIGFVVLLTLVFTYGYTNISNMVSAIIEFQDSRTFLFEELFQDLSGWEQIFGKGSLGTYYSPLFEKQNSYFQRIGHYWYVLDSSTRITVEVGYLQMILKGGFFMLILLVSLKLQAVYLALFRSRNDYVKRMGLFILVLTIISLVSFRPAFTPTFILLWISIGTVLSKKNRLMSNQEVKEKLNLK